MSATDDAWDALPPQEDVGESTWDPTPEAAALRALFGTSAFRLIDNIGHRELAGAGALRDRIAKAYLFAREAHRAKPIERCLFCGTAVTPGQLLGNALANGAMPKMAEHAVKAMRLHTDETDQLRKRVAELEALSEAGARAVDALEAVGKLTSELLREMLTYYDAALEEVVPARPATETTRVAEIRGMLGTSGPEAFPAGQNAREDPG